MRASSVLTALAGCALGLTAGSLGAQSPQGHGIAGFWSMAPGPTPPRRAATPAEAELIAQFRERDGHAAGQLSQRNVQFPFVVRVNRAEDRFGLQQIDPPRQKCSQRKFTWVGQSCAGHRCGVQDCVHQRA